MTLWSENFAEIFASTIKTLEEEKIENEVAAALRMGSGDCDRIDTHRVYLDSGTEYHIMEKKASITMLI